VNAPTATPRLERKRFDPLSPRLHLFTGKGGVGKSTMVAAIALEAVRQGRRPLIVELGHRASMETVLGGGPIGFEPRRFLGGVWAMNMEVDAAIADYVTEHVGIRALARPVLANRALRRFFEAAPAVAEVVTLSKLRGLLRKADGAQKMWHPILVDLDATGHALMLLELPRVLDGLIGTGPLRRLLTSVSETLSDPRTTTLSLVTLPRELPVQETIELHTRLAREHGVRLGGLFVNRVPAAPLGAGSRPALDAVERAAWSKSDDTLIDDLAIVRRELSRHARTRGLIDRLASEIPLPLVEIAELAAPRIGHRELAVLGHAACDGFRFRTEARA
jgi:anion-transporting  ArsA/GET3 family ATPase